VNRIAGPETTRPFYWVARHVGFDFSNARSTSPPQPFQFLPDTE